MTKKEKITMLDIKLIRENPEKTNELLKRRNPELSIDEVLQIDAQRRAVQTQADEMRAKRKKDSLIIGEMKKKGENTDRLQEDVRKIGDEIKLLEEKEVELDQRQRILLLNIPNTPDETTPKGTSEADNKIVSGCGEPTKADFELKAHWDIAEEKGLVDFERAVKISQSRFVMNRGKGAQLERAIINFFLDVHTKEHGYEEILPPVLVNSAAMTGTGQLPKFAEDMYKCENEDLYLIPTAEVPVTNIYQNEILEEEDLPKYMTAYTPCFRREAGSAGKDTRGMIRVHQFNKVELVKLTTPEQSHEEHLKLTKDAEKVLEMLELPYRRIELCTADIGFSAQKCFDLEVYMPSYNGYKEISSCSNFGDFQARRANIRYREKSSGKVQFVHTINGSGLAVGRTFAAIIENFQQEDGTILIPKALHPYTGFEII
ncbi:MAG TPA: serine--tRNA ligase [Candidatus Gastranaerophilaceae bacterium]|nr:serine--tRNA ligase [Candidatus Gastranaerophilaceae bacterium]HPT42054.1 serine--tRNA ligase [Candidatus Gastranaerophilaceae bacterium]